MTAIIYTSFKKKKPKKLNAKQRELKADWEALLKKYEPAKKLKSEVVAWTPTKTYVRETPHIPSLNSGYHDCTKKEVMQYTGTKIKGIGTLHKSNAVPVFTDDEAKDLATMRR